MATPGLVQEHRIVEWNRPGEGISLQEQIDTGGQLNYVQSRPGPWAEAQCACGWVGSGPVAEVASKAKEHVGFVPMR